MSGSFDADSAASHALLSAALGGLLCLASAACGASTEPTEVEAEASSSGGAASGQAGCDAGVDPNPHITSSETIADLTLEAFTADCNTQNGVVEVHPHCGGVNSCRGISYDSDTDTLTEHTCRGANTCTGFSCVVCN